MQTASDATNKQVFYGRFISTPNPTELYIRSGAVLVSGSNGTGVIEATVWDVQDLPSAMAKLGVSNSTPVVQASDSGFFFPGFIGMYCTEVLKGLH